MGVESKVLRGKGFRGKRVLGDANIQAMETRSEGAGRSLVPRLRCCVSLSMSVKVPRMLWEEGVPWGRHQSPQ